jgi:predicted RNA-binding Zn-ribbon protein involved in translation (DUF1610 family)
MSLETAKSREERDRGSEWGYMTNQPANRNGQKQWESVHQCPKCGHTVKLGEIDLRVIATGMIACPNCEWSGPVRIEVVERENPAE